MTFKVKPILVKSATIFACTFVLYFASLQCIPLKNTLSAQENNWVSYRAKVNKINKETKEVYEGTDLYKTTVYFEATIKDAPLKNKTVEAIQVIDDFIALVAQKINVGDNIILLSMEDDQGNDIFVFEEYHRLPSLMVLLVIFVLMVLLFGGLKGVNTIISLLLTCASIFYVFIPAIFTGYNLYKTSILICLYITIMTILIVNGYNKKSFVAILGCFLGVLVAGLLSKIMISTLKLNGFLNNDSLYLISILKNGKADLLALIFSAIIIGSVGAVMDVAMSLSSAIYELKESVENISVKKLIKSGFTIGRDIMGTMANTLILAYIGSSLTFILVLIAYNSSFLSLLNQQMITVEILQALAGSIGILCSIPLTVIIAAVVYSIKIVIKVDKTSD